MSTPTTGGLLRTLSRDLAERLDAPAALVSRLVGELLVPLVEHVPAGDTLHVGLGYLVPDYPLTRTVLRERRAARVALGDADPDPAEAELLRILGYGAVLLLPLVAGEECWGLVEVYRAAGESFSDADEAAAAALVAEAGRALAGR